MANSEDKRPLFNDVEAAMKEQSTLLEMPVSTKLYDRAASVMEPLGLKLEDAVLALIIKLSNGYSSLLGISLEDLAMARLLREMAEAKRSGEEKDWAFDVSVIDLMHRLAKGEEFYNNRRGL